MARRLSSSRVSSPQTYARLEYLPANAAHVFMFGEHLTRLEGEPMFFASRVDACAAAERHGLRVVGRSMISSPVESVGPNPFA